MQAVRQSADRREPLDEIQVMLRDSVREFVRRHPGAARIRALRDDAAGRDAAHAAQAALADNGWLGILVGEAAGGLGLGLAEVCVVAEELGAGLAPETFIADGMAIRVLADGDNASLAAARLPGLLDGSERLALAWQEAANRLDPDEIATRASPVEGGVVLDGVKRLIPGAAGAAAFLVTARGDHGLGVYRVEPGQPGVSLELHAAIDAMPQADLTLSAVAVSAENIVALDAAERLRSTLDEGRLAASAALFGILGQALAMTVDYCRTREQFGKPIGSFQSLQHRLVDMWIQQEISRNTLAHALGVFTSTSDPAARATAASAAKAQASRAALLVTRQAIQLHGGVGYADEHDIGLFLKRAIVLSGWLGTASLHRRRFAAADTSRSDDQA